VREDNRALWVVLGVLVLVLLVGPVFTGGMMGPGMMGWGYVGQGGIPAGNGWLWGLGMGFGGLVMLAFWGALIVGIALLVRWATDHGSSATAGADPLTILRRRYAAGEIDQPTYDRMRSELADSTALREPAATNGRTQVPR
jgi:putative membrane protein